MIRSKMQSFVFSILMENAETNDETKLTLKKGKKVFLGGPIRPLSTPPNIHILQPKIKSKSPKQ